MRQFRNNNIESKKNKTRKEYELKMNLGEKIKDKIKKFTNVFKKVKKYDEDKTNNISFSENNNEYYENFLQNLQDDENKNNKKKLSKKKKGKNDKTNISNNINFKTSLRHSLMKPKETNNCNLTPKIKENLKINSILVNKRSSSKINQSNDIQSSLFHSRLNSNKSKENLNERNSYILNDIKNHKSIVLGNINVRNSKIQTSFTPNRNFKNTNFSSIKSKKSPAKFMDNNNNSLVIKNTKSENLKKEISLKNDEKTINNSLEEESGINFKQNYNFNPKKINVESIKKKNIDDNYKNNNENIGKELEKNDVKSPSESTLKIHLKKRCFFCCLPIY